MPSGDMSASSPRQFATVSSSHDGIFPAHTEEARKRTSRTWRMIAKVISSGKLQLKLCTAYLARFSKFVGNHLGNRVHAVSLIRHPDAGVSRADGRVVRVNGQGGWRGLLRYDDILYRGKGWADLDACAGHL